MGWWSKFKDDVLGFDPNGQGIYGAARDVLGDKIADDILGMDPNGGGAIGFYNAVGPALLLAGAGGALGSLGEAAAGAEGAGAGGLDLGWDQFAPPESGSSGLDLGWDQYAPPGETVPPGYGTEVSGLNPGSTSLDKIVSGTGSKLLSGLGSKLLSGLKPGGGSGGGSGGGIGGEDLATILGAIAGGSGIGSNTSGAKGFDWEKLRNPPAPTDPINWGKMRMVGDDPYASRPSEDYSNLAKDLGVSGASSASATPHYTFGQPVNPSDIMDMIGSGKSAAANSGGVLGALFKPGGGSGGNTDPESGNYPGAPGMRGGGKVHADHPGVPVVEGRFDYRNGSAVNGPGDGQSDDIPAMLADGEYVIDAELVSMLGNGSNKAGAKVLDKFRESVREHKRSAPLGKIPPKSKSPLAYLKEVQNG